MKKQGTEQKDRQLITASQVQILRKETRSSLQACYKAMVRAEGNMLLAAGIITFDGCAINVPPAPGQSREQAHDNRVMRQARGYAARAHATSMPRRINNQQREALMDIETLTTGTIEEIKEEGPDRGYNSATWVDVPEYGQHVDKEIFEDGIILDEGEARDYFTSAARAHESTTRQYESFEQYENALNARDDADEAWEALDEGIQHGIEKNADERDFSFVGELCLCQDCHDYERTGDATFIDAHYQGDEAEQRYEEISEGLERLPELYAVGDDQEYSHVTCDSCGSNAIGARYGYVKQVDFGETSPSSNVETQPQTKPASGPEMG